MEFLQLAIKYAFFFCLLVALQPRGLFDDDGRVRPFGTSYPETPLPLWLVSLALAVVWQPLR